MPLTVRFAVPSFVSATDLATLLVPIAHVENVRLEGDRVAFDSEITVVLVRRK
jgi:hypothetical protein